MDRPTVVSVALLAAVLAGSIVTVATLSARDAISLAGGIAVFAVSITAWFAVTVGVGMRFLRRRRAGSDGTGHHALPARHGPRPAGR